MPTKYRVTTTVQATHLKRIIISTSGPTGVPIQSDLTAGTNIICYSGPVGVNQPGQQGALPAFNIFIVGGGQGFPSGNAGLYSDVPIPVHTIGTIDFETED